MLRRVKIITVGTAVIALMLGALGSIGYAVQAIPHSLATHVGNEMSHPPQKVATGSVPTGRVQVPTHEAPLVGVFENGVPQSWGPVQSFASATGAKPRIALYYSGWPEQFWPRFAAAAYAHHAAPFVQLQPSNVSLTAITRGRYDGYLRSYAYAVRGFGHPVILSFGHEMNGNWYSWGAGHVSPSDFRAAWRHVVSVFRAVGAANVTWLWSVSSLNAANSPLRQWWPGSKWVNWVGIDGYYYRSTDTFNSVFGTTIHQIRHFTSAPILISEVGIGPSANEARQIKNLFQRTRANHLLGFVWFDMAQHGGAYHQDWRLEDDPTALAAFRKAVKTAKGGLRS